MIAGKYKLLEEIGEGGMGTVFVAEQTEPVKRKVAVKLIKPGMDSKSVLARFEAERQALAMMDHPNIARVLDAGLTEERRPYFIMEYIKGLPLTKYCDDVKLSIDERLKLFIQICQAVQHAHQKGIIHRDLKPGNILIALYDGKPVPKVIDFGLAKALHHSLTERTLHTGHEMVLGTPLYMSPEQAELNNLDIDTRSDIYSLGLILYELLTGVTPLEKQRFKEAAWGEVLRIIKEEEPSKPSTKLSQSNSLPSVAAQRQMEPKKLSSLMKGDLDWIVMKALEKDRNRRYETANGFAADVNRYLTGETVLAHPPTWWYRYRKFSQRHRRALLTSYMLLAGIVIFTGTLYSQMARAKTAEKLAQEAQAEAIKQAEGERVAKEQATKRLTQVEKANELLGSIFENLDPEQIAKAGRPLQAILVEKLDKALTQIEGESIGDPQIVAAMQFKIGRSLLGLGVADKAIIMLKKALVTQQSSLGHDHPDTLSTNNYLAMAYLAAGKRNLAVPLYEENLALRKMKLGLNHPDTIASMSNLAGAYDADKRYLAVPLFEESLKLSINTLGRDHPDTLIGMNNLANSYQSIGKGDLAMPLYEECLKLMKVKLGPDHPDTLRCMSNLGMMYRASRKIDLALQLCEEAFKISKETLGMEHPDTLKNMNNLATTYRAAGMIDRALPLLEQTLKLLKAKLGTDHPDTLKCMNQLAFAHWQTKQLDKSIPLFEEALKRQTATLGRNHAGTISTMANLAVNYKDAGKLPEAIALLEEAFQAFKKYPTMRSFSEPLLEWYVLSGKGEAATSLVKQLLEDARKSMPNDSPLLADKLASFGLSLVQVRSFAHAEPILRECLTIREKASALDWTTFHSQSLLGAALLGQTKYAEAESLLLKGFEGMNARLPTSGADAARLSIKERVNEALDHLIQLYTETNKPEEVKKWQAEKAKHPGPSTKLAEKK